MNTVKKQVNANKWNTGTMRIFRAIVLLTIKQKLRNFRKNLWAKLIIIGCRPHNPSHDIFG